MSIINTGAISKALMPGVREWFGNMYNRYPEEYSKIFETKKSMKNFEEEVNLHGFGLGAVIPEGTGVTYDTMKAGPVKRYVHVEYGRGFIVSRVAMEDNQYPEVARSMSEMLGHGMKQLKETVGANILNRANNSSYVGFDGVELSSAVHLKTKGGTYSNELAVASNLSEASLEQALIDIGGFEDDAGLKMQAQGMLLVIPRQLEFEAQRILKSDLKNDTAENALNVLKSGRYLPQGFVVNHYLSSASKWFVKTNVPKGLTHYERRALEIKNDTDFDSENMKFKMTERYSFGWTDPRGMFFNGE
jgi:phage major head subunit gpT-like protein